MTPSYTCAKQNGLVRPTRCVVADLEGRGNRRCDCDEAAAVACSECGKPLTAEEAQYYEVHCEACEARLMDMVDAELSDTKGQPAAMPPPRVNLDLTGYLPRYAPPETALLSEAAAASRQVYDAERRPVLRHLAANVARLAYDFGEPGRESLEKLEALERAVQALRIGYDGLQRWREERWQAQQPEPVGAAISEPPI